MVAALAAILLALAVVSVAYLPSFRVPFLFDDQTAIVDNTSIRHGPLSSEAWRPPGDGNTVQGRPLLNASFAANYAIHELDPGSYHAVNLGIHLANAMLLGVVLYLLFRSPRWASVLGERAFALAFASATIWALHPIQALAVTYLAQRAESLVSFFYLAALAAWLGARQRAMGRPLLVSLAVVSCALGMLTKEVMATAPITILLLDRLLYPSDAEPLPSALRWGRVGLAATWGLLLWILVENDFSRGASTATEFVSRAEYLTTQAFAIPLYVATIVWPAEITFDHGLRVVSDAASLAISGLAWIVILAPFVWLLHRRHWRAALSLALFFLLLAPSSSLVPIATQTIAEHRVYLASSIVIAAIVVAVDRLARTLDLGRGAAVLGVLVCMVLGVLTWQLNQRLQDPVRLWQSVAEQVPSNWRAFHALGVAYAQRGDDRSAIAALDRSLALEPRHVKSWYNRGNARRRSGDWKGAEQDYEMAVQRNPAHVSARNNLAMLLRRRNDDEGARRQLEAVLRYDPTHASAWYNLALIRFERGDLARSVEAIDAYLGLRPESAKGWRLAGDAHRALGDTNAARAAEERAFAIERGPAGAASDLEPPD